MSRFQPRWSVLLAGPNQQRFSVCARGIDPSMAGARARTEVSERWFIPENDLQVVSTVEEPVTPGEDFQAGYDLGRVAMVGCDLPHPDGFDHPHQFFHGARAALRGRGLDLSLFLRAIAR